MNYNSIPNHEKSPDELLREAVAEYDSALRDTADQHRRGMYPIVDKYAENIDHLGAVEFPDVGEFSVQLQRPRTAVKDLAYKTTVTTTTLFDTVYTTVAPSLSGVDKESWSAIEKHADLVGPDSSVVVRLLSSVSSPAASAAMRAALDKRLWAKIDHTAELVGPDSSVVVRLLSSASSPAASAAMRAALDKRLWAKIDHTADLVGPDDSVVVRLLSSASSPAASAAMRAALDKRLWAKIDHTAKLIGPDSFFVVRLLSSASSPAVLSLIKRTLQAKYSSQQSRPDSQPNNGNDYGTPDGEKLRYDDIDPDDFISDIMSRMFNRARRGSDSFSGSAGNRSGDGDRGYQWGSREGQGTPPQGNMPPRPHTPPRTSETPPTLSYVHEIDSAILALRAQGLTTSQIRGRLARKFHPDNSPDGDESAMKYLNSQLYKK